MLPLLWPLSSPFHINRSSPPSMLPRPSTHFRRPQQRLALLWGESLPAGCTAGCTIGNSSPGDGNGSPGDGNGYPGAARQEEEAVSQQEPTRRAGRRAGRLAGWWAGRWEKWRWAGRRWAGRRWAVGSKQRALCRRLGAMLWGGWALQPPERMARGATRLCDGSRLRELLRRAAR